MSDEGFFLMNDYLPYYNAKANQKNYEQELTRVNNIDYGDVWGFRYDYLKQACDSSKQVHSEVDDLYDVLQNDIIFKLNNLPLEGSTNDENIINAKNYLAKELNHLLDKSDGFKKIEDNIEQFKEDVEEADKVIQTQIETSLKGAVDAYLDRYETNIMALSKVYINSQVAEFMGIKNTNDILDEAFYENNMIVYQLKKMLSDRFYTIGSGRIIVESEESFDSKCSGLYEVTSIVPRALIDAFVFKDFKGAFGDLNGGASGLIKIYGSFNKDGDLKDAKNAFELGDWHEFLSKSGYAGSKYSGEQFVDGSKILLDIFSMKYSKGEGTKEFADLWNIPNKYLGTSIEEQVLDKAFDPSVGTFEGEENRIFEMVRAVYKNKRAIKDVGEYYAKYCSEYEVVTTEKVIENYGDGNARDALFRYEYGPKPEKIKEDILALNPTKNIANDIDLRRNQLRVNNGYVYASQMGKAEIDALIDQQINEEFAERVSGVRDEVLDDAIALLQR